MTIVVGSHIWVENPVWIDGEVLNIKGDDAEIQTSDGSKVVYYLLVSFSRILGAESSLVFI